MVFEDADVSAAATSIARRAFLNGGQYCTTVKKAYIHRSLYDNVRKEILDTVQGLTVGDALDPRTDIGPIRVERTRNILQNALEKFRAARLITGAITGQTVFPLVLETENIDIPDLELFGPLLLLIPFDDPHKAAMELAKTRYGFLLSFFGSPAEKIKALFHSHFGMVSDNPGFTFTPLRLPFGGKKASGWILERKGNHWIERDGAFIYSKELAK
jgi:acyl-CoA reductase-like NAD-dependent aldehyde dehydrogenase